MLVTPSSASGFSALLGDSYWGNLIGQVYESSVPAKEYFQHLLDSCHDLGCSLDGGSHAWSIGGLTTGFLSGYWDARCSKCNCLLSEYLNKASLDSDDLRDTYSNAVSALPAEEYDSAGELIWHTSLRDIVPNSNSEVYLGSRYDISSGLPIASGGTRISGSGNRLDFSKPSDWGSRFGVYDLHFVAPLDGYYEVVESPLAVFSVEKEGTTYSYSYVYPSEVLYTYSLGQDLSITCGYDIDAVLNFYSDKYDSASGSIYLPVFRIIPDVLPSGIAANYAVDTRPAAFIGDYSVVGDNNEVTVDNRSIVNETTTTIYNPVTGDTTTYDNWSYDYSTRTYTMTNNSDNSISTVTYGDEYMSIHEGGNTYNVYFCSKVLDALIRLVETITDKVGDIIEALLGWMDYLPGLFSGFLGFLGATFAFLPPDLVTMLSFGVVAVSFVGIIKAFRR